ncbi:MAG: diaminopimelate epimerase [Candidatus Omnitrophica bacterium]|nr:diaminopimelate epimerase [Candidatus Omnitrophota bacterium]
MKRIKFTKMVASGNDFVVVDSGIGRDLTRAARAMCDRKFGIGSDGLLVLEKSKAADIRMRIFNADGSEAEMCGNGARCTALYISRTPHAARRTLKIETKAGIIEAMVCGDNVKIKLTAPKDLKQDILIRAGLRNIKVNFIDTGVPHAVIFAEGLDKINLKEIAPLVRFNKKFAPKGTNVDIIEVLNNDSFKIRTYERGVEDETLACGTGSVASALIFALKTGSVGKINVHTKSGEVLKVYFDRKINKFSNVWLEGRARIVYKGEYYV